MDKYKNMRSISNIKARMKIAVFYFLDIMCLLGTYMVTDFVQKFIHFKGSTYILFLITNLLLCFFLCLPSPNNPKRNNFSILLLYFMKDKRKFLSNDFKFIKKMRKE